MIYIIEELLSFLGKTECICNLLRGNCLVFEIHVKSHWDCFNHFTCILKPLHGLIFKLPVIKI